MLALLVQPGGKRFAQWFQHAGGGEGFAPEAGRHAVLGRQRAELVPAGRRVQKISRELAVKPDRRSGAAGVERDVVERFCVKRPYFGFTVQQRR